MLCTYTISYEDYLAAQRLHLRLNGKDRILFVTFQRIMPVLAVFAVGVLVWDMGFHNFSLPPWLAGVLSGIAWLGIICPVLRVLRLRRGYKALKNGSAADGPIELELTSTELISRVPGKSEGRLLPGGINDFAEDDRVGLVYVAKKTFLVLPKRMMPEENWATLRLWLAQRNQEKPC